MRTLALVVLCSLSSFAHGAGFDLSAPVIGSAAYPIKDPRIAGNGKTFLSVWRMDTFGAGAHIYGSLADANGNRLIGESLPVVSGIGDGVRQLMPYGDHYVVTFNASVQVHGNAAELSSEGKAIRMFSVPPGYWWVTNGDKFLDVEYTHVQFGPQHLYGYLYDRNGKAIKTAIDLDQSLGTGTFAATATGNDFLVGMSTEAGILVERISPAGDTKWRSTIAAPGATVRAVASDGSDALIFWSTPAGLFAAVARSDGALEPPSIIANLSSGSLGQVEAGAIDNGYAVAVVQASGEVVFRLDRNGALMQSTALESQPYPVAGTIAIAGNAMSDVTIEGFPTGGRVISRSFAIASAVHLLHNEVVSTLAHRQFSPVIASDGVGFLCAWADQTAETQAVTLGAIVSQTASAADAGHDVQRANGFMGGYTIAYGGSSYLIVWSYWQALWAQRFRAGGSPIDPVPLMVTSNIQNLTGVSAAWNGSRFLIVWTRNDRVFDAFVNTDGTVSPEQQVFQVPLEDPYLEGYSLPDLAWDGQRFLLVATSYRTLKLILPPCGNCGNFATKALRLFADGSVMDSNATLIADATQRAHVASSGHNFGIAVDTLSSSVLSIIADASGPMLTLQTPVPIFRWRNDVLSDIVWSGYDYVVGVRYQFAGHAWLALRPTDGPALLVETGLSDRPAPPSLAATLAGNVLAVISEVTTPEGARARAYDEDELTPMPSPPSAPVGVSAIRGHFEIAVSWNASHDATGFVVQGVYQSGDRYVFPTVAGNATSTVINDYGFNTVEVIAFNGGGATQTVATVTSPPRHRATR